MQVSKLMMFGLGVALVAGCTDTDSATNLNPVGPPMLRQVRMNSKVTNADGSQSNKRVFAFGSHELAEPDELQSNQVTSAVAVNNSMRLIIDELLVGNNLEEIACRSAVDNDAFQQVPIGATPDDIARCSVADDVLSASCTGPTAVCICQNETGCISSTGGVIELGAPVGVLDFNQDGATDDSQFIESSVGLLCGTINVPIDLEKSYWNPSGDQNRPAVGGFEALGPAVVLTPLGPLPTNLKCQLVFSDSVVDKQGIRVCAPPDGDVNQDCQEGDMSNFSFNSEILKLKPSEFIDGQTGVNKGSGITLSATAPLEPATVQTATNNITVVATTGPQPTITLTFDPMSPQVVSVSAVSDCDGAGGNPPAAGFCPNTEYTLTITQGVTDTFDQPPPAPQVFTFTTGN